MRSWSFKILVVSIFIAIIGITAFIVWHQNLKIILGAKIFEYSYQFLLLIFLGGSASVLFKEISKNKTQYDEQNRLHKEIVKNLYDRLIKAYSETKQIRRLIKARVLTYTRDPKGEVIRNNEGKSRKSVYVEPYDIYMERLSKIQLEFEFFRFQLTSNPSILGVPDLSKSLGSLDNYLGDIIFEYQERRRKFKPDSLTQEISFLPKLGEFVLDYDKGFSFKTGFKDHFYKAINGLSIVLLS